MQQPTSYPILEKLRAETGELHKKLDTSLYPLIQGMKTPEEYAKLLQTFYAYFKPLEEKVYKYIGDAELKDHNERRNTGYILKDLETINQSTEIEPAKETPEINNTAAAFGALYVMEGSTLGGKIIAKTIASNLGYTDTNALNFFSGYKEHTGPKWLTFIEALNNFAISANDDETIIEAAKSSFQKLKQHIDNIYQFVD